MVYRRRARKSNRPIRRRRNNRRANRARMFNPRPVFTETFRLRGPSNQPYVMSSNSGGILSVNMDQLPQLSQYTALYTKYRILKAKFIILPDFNTESADVNASVYNNSIGITALGMSRFVFAQNDSPQLNAPGYPANEGVVLQDNGCRIVPGKPKLEISCRPVPSTLDQVNVAMTMARKFINFNSAQPNVTHFGITWWHTQVLSPPNQDNGVNYNVYVKVTFQLADPR